MLTDVLFSRLLGFSTRLRWRNLARNTLVVGTALLVSACSDDETAKDDHVFKDKAQTIDKARDVERQLGEAAARLKKAGEKAADQ